MTDKIDHRGLYRKFEVRRTDGSSESGGKHANCSYFVLDLEHDEFAIRALKAYARACRKTHPDLAEDLDTMLEVHARAQCGCREAHCPHVGFLGPTASTAAEALMEISDRNKTMTKPIIDKKRTR